MFIHITQDRLKLDNLLHQKHVQTQVLKYSAVEIWSKIPPEIKNKTFSGRV